MKIKSDYKARIRFLFNVPPEQLCANIDELEMSNRATNGLKRLGVETVEGILENWYTLGDLSNIAGRQQGLGRVSITEIHAATFAWLNQNGYVTRMVIR